MNGHEDDLLALSLSINSLSSNLGVPSLSPSPSPPPPPNEKNIAESNVAVLYGYMNEQSEARARVGLTTHARTRRMPTQSLKEGNSETITPPYPWATSRRAIVHTLDYLVSNEITVISGEVQCKKCEQQYQIQYDLQEKFKEIATFISKTRSVMHDRAPIIWMNPNLPNCKYCNQINCIKPIISEERKLLDLKSEIETKTYSTSDDFGHMLPKGVPIPPSGPSCRLSPGTPPSCSPPVAA
ncbi:hypothetical protein HAX54_021630 [Datura stramonium]|uniref:DUF7086 domain-containing protein n=1 Tax=Datura stramonium TaxID=4076 RepID=A0ABS8UVI3_DATST|nr:hypothetical protein [Datura stramonium]